MSNFKLTTSSGKHLEDVTHSHLFSLKYKLIRSAKDAGDLSKGFNGSRIRRQEELINKKNLKGDYQLRIMLKDVLGFAGGQERATFGLGCQLTITRNRDDAVLDKAAGVADAGIKINHIQCYVPHYTPSIPHQSILSKQNSSETPIELRFIERSVFMTEVNNQNLWNFEIASQESMNVHIWIFIWFQQRDRQDSQNLKIDTFCRLPVTGAQCIIGMEKHPDAGIMLN